MGTPVPYASEQYRLRPHLLQQVLAMCKVHPEIDAFSCADTKCCPRYWGPGSIDGCDAFKQRWDQHILWLNPPYSMMEQVVTKIRANQAHGIVVAPEWPTKVWWEPLQRLAVWRWRLSSGTKVFELGHRPCKPTRWAVQILVVCGADPPCSLLDLRAGNIHAETIKAQSSLISACAWAALGGECAHQEPHRPTKSAKRRWRKQRLKERFARADDFELC